MKNALHIRSYQPLTLKEQIWWDTDIILLNFWCWNKTTLTILVEIPLNINLEGGNYIKLMYHWDNYIYMHLKKSIGVLLFCCNNTSGVRHFLTFVNTFNKKSGKSLKYCQQICVNMKLCAFPQNIVRLLRWHWQITFWWFHSISSSKILWKNHSIWICSVTTKVFYHLSEIMIRKYQIK